ncbi:MAG: SMI1/KNR4 family protein [Oligoflexales bacterium]
MENLISRIASSQGCIMYPPNNETLTVGQNHKIPQDLKQFFDRCGGAILFEGSDYEMEILSPQSIVPANPLIVGELCEKDISSSWYVIAKDCDGQYLTIDFNELRLGRCYESFTDSHGLVGDCPIIAKSFSDLIDQLLIAKGRYCYWTEKSFKSLGDAYD